MLFEDSGEFIAQNNLRLTLVGMSNVGKTTLASKLPKTNWFHYSVDYRIATAHLNKAIIDVIKEEMAKSDLLAEHLREDLISVGLNITVNNIDVVSRYLGKLGDPGCGGRQFNEYMERQQRHRSAETASILEIPDFIARGEDIYRCQHFINDSSGSLCEIIDPDDDDDPVLRTIIRNTTLLYIKPDKSMEAELVGRAKEHSKPLYFRPEFLVEAIEAYSKIADVDRADVINPHHFANWVFPPLLASRRSRYERIAHHGYTLPARDIADVRDEKDFVRLICRAIDTQQSAPAVAGLLR